MKSNEVLVLRKTNENLKSYNGFEYPRLGKVETLDWKDDDNESSDDIVVVYCH